MQVRIDYVRVTESSVMANITIQFENRDLQFQKKDGVEKSLVNLFGRVTSMTRRPITTFEKPLEVDAPPDMLAEIRAAAGDLSAVRSARARPVPVEYRRQRHHRRQHEQLRSGARCASLR